MVFILNEQDATRIFEKYRNVAAFTLSKGLKGISREGLEVSYEKLTFLPDEDTINAIKAGDMKLKKVIKNAVKALRQPTMNEAAIGLGMTQLVNIITSNRKHKKGPAILVFVYDDEDAARNKIMVKYLTALFAEFGLAVITSGKKVKKIFKKRKKCKDNVNRFIRNNKGMTLNKKGVELKKLNTFFYEMELRQSGLSNLTDVRRLGSDRAATCVKTLIKVYSAENLQNMNSKKTAKRLAKKDKTAVRAYKDLRMILKSMDSSLKMPKVEYGQKKKKGKAVGRKMDSKKFIKFFTKKKNRSYLMLVYAHTLAVLLDLEIGSKEYGSYMKKVCSAFDNGEFGKEFVSAAAAYAKGTTEK